MDLRGDYEGKAYQFALWTRVRDLSDMGYYLDLSDAYRLCFWPCRPRTCLMMAS